MVKNLPAVPETQVPSLGQEGPLKEGIATHSSILAWGIPWTEGPGGLQSLGSQRVRPHWGTNTHTRCQYPHSISFPPEKKPVKNHQSFCLLIKLYKWEKIKPAPQITPFQLEILPLLLFSSFLFGQNLVFTVCCFTPYHDFSPGAIGFNVQPYQMLFEILGK